MKQVHFFQRPPDQCSNRGFNFKYSRWWLKMSKIWRHWLQKKSILALSKNWMLCSCVDSHKEENRSKCGQGGNQCGTSFEYWVTLGLLGSWFTWHGKLFSATKRFEVSLPVCVCVGICACLCFAVSDANWGSTLGREGHLRAAVIVELTHAGAADHSTVGVSSPVRMPVPETPDVALWTNR